MRWAGVSWIEVRLGMGEMKLGGEVSRLGLKPMLFAGLLTRFGQDDGR